MAGGGWDSGNEWWNWRGHRGRHAWNWSRWRGAGLCRKRELAGFVSQPCFQGLDFLRQMGKLSTEALLPLLEQLQFRALCFVHAGPYGQIITPSNLRNPALDRAMEKVPRISV